MTGSEWEAGAERIHAWLTGSSSAPGRTVERLPDDFDRDLVRFRVTLPNGNAVQLSFVERIVINRKLLERMLAELLRLGTVADDASGGRYTVGEIGIVPYPLAEE